MKISELQLFSCQAHKIHTGLSDSAGAQKPFPLCEVTLAIDGSKDLQTAGPKTGRKYNKTKSPLKNTLHKNALRLSKMGLKELVTIQYNVKALSRSMDYKGLSCVFFQIICFMQHNDSCK